MTAYADMPIPDHKPQLLEIPHVIGRLEACCRDAWWCDECGRWDHLLTPDGDWHLCRQCLRTSVFEQRRACAAQNLAYQEFGS